MFQFDRTIVLGRGPMCDMILHDATVSRRHAMLNWTRSECLILDLNSENGTFVNHRRISEPTPLSDGDVLNLGSVTTKYTRAARMGSLSDSFSWREKENESGRVLATMDAEDSSLTAYGEEESGLLVENLSKGYRFLNDLGNVVSESFDVDDVLRFVLDEIFELLPQAARAFILLRDRETGQLIPRGASAREESGKKITASRTLVEEAVNKREGILLIDVMTEERFVKGVSVQGPELTSAMCVPMIFNNEIYGVMQVDTNVGPPFGKPDMALLLNIAQQIGTSLAYTHLHSKLLQQELLERDLMLARRLQQQFLPQRLPRISEFNFAVEYSPALAVGGDFYDFLELAEGRIGIAVADVSGKGVSAALYAAKLSSEIRYHSVGQSEPSEILSRLNRALTRDSREGVFVTLVLLVLTPGSGEFTVSSAGHPLPVVRRRGEAPQVIGQGGDPPLGLDAGARFHSVRHVLDPFAVVTLYTDGITEAESGSRELFGDKRFLAAMRDADETPNDVLNAVLSAVSSHIGGAAQSDDITLLCFSRSG